MSRTLRVLRERLWWLGREGDHNDNEPAWRYGPIQAWQCAKAIMTLEDSVPRWEEISPEASRRRAANG